ncbi:MAG TPA: NAD(P)-dependent oxidoreductase, partial [Anaerolineae bacterium]|nr:NAD(P)-dependent oxidoreductase [Anaerolineae bacterium]
MNIERRTLITGATGFIGHCLARRLVETGAEVWAGVFPGEPPERVEGLPEEVRRIPLDVRDGESVDRAVARCKPEVVFHLAAVGVTDPGVTPFAALAVNVVGTIHLLESLQKQAIRRIVLVGTCYEYGAREAPEGLDPFNFYAASKVAAWAFARAYWRAFCLPVVVARPFQVYGPDQPPHTLVPSAIHAALAGEDFPMTPGEQKRDFIYVEDVVEGLLTAATTPSIQGQSLDLGTGQVHSVRRVVERIWEITGARGRILPGALAYRPGEVMPLAADADRTARL